MHGLVPTSYGPTRGAEAKSERVLGTRKPGYAYLVPGSVESPDGIGRRDVGGTSEMGRRE